MTALLPGADASLVLPTMSAEPVPYLTEREYLIGEEFADVKHEYYDGIIYAMAGASDPHELVSTNFLGLLWSHLRGKNCRVYKSDMKLRLTFRGKIIFYYPDVMVACDPAEKDPVYREKPRLIIEVASRNWRKDTVEKAATYAGIPTLEEYVVAVPNPDRPKVQISRRENGWEPVEVVEGMESEFTLRSVGLTLKVADLFAV